MTTPALAQWRRRSSAPLAPSIVNDDPLAPQAPAALTTRTLNHPGDPGGEGNQSPSSQGDNLITQHIDANVPPLTSKDVFLFYLIHQHPTASGTSTTTHYPRDGHDSPKSHYLHDDMTWTDSQ